MKGWIPSGPVRLAVSHMIREKVSGFSTSRDRASSFKVSWVRVLVFGLEGRENRACASNGVHL